MAQGRRLNVPTGQNFLDIIEGIKIEKGEVYLLGSDNKYYNIRDFNNRSIEGFLKSYNKFIKEEGIQAPSVATSYLRNHADYVENFEYIIKKAHRSNKDVKSIYSKYTGNTPESFDKMSAKEKMTASALFDLATEYHLLDRASQYYDTDTIKSIYDVATDKRYSRLGIEDFKAELIELLYDRDIIDESMYNSMSSGEHVSLGLSKAASELLGF